MTKLEALRMVRSASIYAGSAVTQMTIHSRAYTKAAKAVINTFEHAERGLEFEVGFEDWCHMCDRPKNDCGCVENGGSY